MEVMIDEWKNSESMQYSTPGQHEEAMKRGQSFDTDDDESSPSPNTLPLPKMTSKRDKSSSLKD